MGQPIDLAQVWVAVGLLRVQLVGEKHHLGDVAHATVAGGVPANAFQHLGVVESVVFELGRGKRTVEQHRESSFHRARRDANCLGALYQLCAIERAGQVVRSEAQVDQLSVQAVAARQPPPDVSHALDVVSQTCGERVEPR